jgi:hypothetical protein
VAAPASEERKIDSGDARYAISRHDREIGRGVKALLLSSRYCFGSFGPFVPFVLFPFADVDPDVPTALFVS